MGFFDSCRDECIFWEKSLFDFLDGLALNRATCEELIASYGDDPQFLTDACTEIGFSDGIREAIISISMLREIIAYLSEELNPSTENTETAELLFNMFYVGFHVGRTVPAFKCDCMESTIKNLTPIAQRGYEFMRSGKGKSLLRLRTEEICRKRWPRLPTFEQMLVILLNGSHNDIISDIDAKESKIYLAKGGKTDYINYEAMFRKAKKDIEIEMEKKFPFDIKID